MTRPIEAPAPPRLTLGKRPTDLPRLLLASCTSDHTRRSYAKAIDELAIFADTKPVTALLVMEWRTAMAERLSTATVNLRLTAVRSLVREARRKSLVTADEAAELLDVRGLPQRGTRAGNWLEAEQVRRLLTVPSRTTLRGKRNYCILAILLGCALRRYELAELDCETLQLREGRWVFADLMGKGGRVRTVAVPGWVKDAIDAWRKAAGITEGRLIRQLSCKPEGLSAYAIWEIVNAAARRIGVAKFGPHDLRRTCARLCRRRGGDIQQIQFMLGHASVLTTERYLGTAQDLSNAVNDDLGL